MYVVIFTADIKNIMHRNIVKKPKQNSKDYLIHPKRK
jgi:hypothetical protein